MRVNHLHSLPVPTLSYPAHLLPSSCCPTLFCSDCFNNQHTHPHDSYGTLCCYPRSAVPAYAPPERTRGSVPESLGQLPVPVVTPRDPFAGHALRYGDEDGTQKDHRSGSTGSSSLARGRSELPDIGVPPTLHPLLRPALIRPQCHNLAQGLLPTIIQWFRASATPASLCASAGVCGDVLVKANVLNEVCRAA